MDEKLEKAQQCASLLRQDLTAIYKSAFGDNALSIVVEDMLGKLADIIKKLERLGS